MPRLTLPNTPIFSAVKPAFKTIGELPYCSGTFTNRATFFYRSGDRSGLVNFMDATEARLFSLANPCQPATFGVQRKDGLDESYRKAGKMVEADFSMQFSPVIPGILDTVREALLWRRMMRGRSGLELYKLNVYGPGSFFKSHVDTSRSDTMFGSLVVVLPTVHEGGNLIFRHRGREHTFDSAYAVTSQELPSAVFVVFYSDIEHEVSVVIWGYCVTLTYNIYFAKPPSPTGTLGIIPRQAVITDEEGLVGSSCSS